MSLQLRNISFNTSYILQIMRKIIIPLVFLLIPALTFGQRWKRERLEAFAGVGTNHFMGDLGGGSQDAAHFFGVRDMDWEYTRPTIQVGVRYRILQELSVKPVFTYGYLRGDDASSGSEGRRKRNLSFRSHLLELGTQVEYYFIKEREMAKYTFSSMRAMNRLSAFGFIGGGGFYFNPQAKLDGEWHDLQPLKTEGQDSPYSKFAGYLSMGLGAKFRLQQRISIGLEISNRYTTTDYLDDAHDAYFDYTDGSIADQLADRHIDEDGYPLPDYETGTPMRGDKEYNDAYILTMITGYYRFKYSMRSLPKF